MRSSAAATVLSDGLWLIEGGKGQVEAMDTGEQMVLGSNSGFEDGLKLPVALEGHAVLDIGEGR